MQLERAVNHHGQAGGTGEGEMECALLERKWVGGERSDESERLILGLRFVEAVSRDKVKVHAAVPG